MCVGCGTCAAACPEPGAITLQGKLATVDQELCKGHGECVAACPVGAIVLASGEASHRVEVPQLDQDFQTNVPGIYIVGELGGRGLIKNAINEGRVAIENVARDLAGAGPRVVAEDAASEAFDVIIVGAGPRASAPGSRRTAPGSAMSCWSRGPWPTPSGSIPDTSSSLPNRCTSRSTASCGWRTPPRRACCRSGRRSSPTPASMSGPPTAW